MANYPQLLSNFLQIFTKVGLSSNIKLDQITEYAHGYCKSYFENSLDIGNLHPEDQ